MDCLSSCVIGNHYGLNRFRRKYVKWSIVTAQRAIEKSQKSEKNWDYIRIMQIHSVKRLTGVQRMLITTDEPITQIAQSSGFSTIARFNSTFLKLVGCTPCEYRKNMCL